MANSEELPDIVDFTQIDALLDVAGRDGVSDIMAAFWRSTESLVGQMQALLKDRNYSEAARAAHALKGSAANVGAQLMAAAARNIEAGCKNSDCEAAMEALSHLGDAGGKTRIAIARRIDQAA